MQVIRVLYRPLWLQGMKLSGSGGQSFTLTLQGYQFPDGRDDPHDNNWLFVAVDVSHPKGDWRASDPSLLTWEVARLADWLESVAKGGQSSASEDFLEPTLEFHVVDEQQTKALRVLFGLELRPKWAESEVASEGDVYIDFPMTEIDLVAAAQELRRQLLRFPQRGHA